MAAMKPRTGDGPLEVTKEGRGLVMRVPLEGGGRLVVELSADEASALSEALTAAIRKLVVRTTWGVTKPLAPDRWCSICQGHDHIATTCEYPTTSGWKCRSLATDNHPGPSKTGGKKPHQVQAKGRRGGDKGRK